MALGSKGRKYRHSGIYLLGDNPHSNVTDSHGQCHNLDRNFGTFLQLGLGRRKIARGHGVVEADARVGSVAERFVLLLPAAAEGNYVASGQPEGGTGGPDNLEIP